MYDRIEQQELFATIWLLQEFLGTEVELQEYSSLTIILVLFPDFKNWCFKICVISFIAHHKKPKKTPNHTCSI